MNAQEHAILLAEDSQEDAFFVQRAFKKLNFSCRLERVTDGQQAIDYLNGANGFSDRKQFPLPRLFLCDLKMPVKNGFEVLEWIRQNPTFKNLPVLVLTSSNISEDMDKAYKLGANSYLNKDILLEQPAELVRVIAQYL